MYTWGVFVFVEKFSAKKISQILRISPVLRNLSLTRLDSVYSFSKYNVGASRDLCEMPSIVKEFDQYYRENGECPDDYTSQCQYVILFKRLKI
jgi:hypothetical protein